jgi:hypothetical protein
LLPCPQAVPVHTMARKHNVRAHMFWPSQQRHLFDRCRHCPPPAARRQGHPPRTAFPKCRDHRGRLPRSASLAPEKLMDWVARPKVSPTSCVRETFDRGCRTAFCGSQSTLKQVWAWHPRPPQALLSSRKPPRSGFITCNDIQGLVMSSRAVRGRSNLISSVSRLAKRGTTGASSACVSSAWAVGSGGANRPSHGTPGNAS